MRRERTLVEYDEELAGRYAGPSGDHNVTTELKNLHEGATWMNIGTGDGGAEENVLYSPDYRNIHQVIGVDAIHFGETTELTKTDPKRFQYLSRKTLQESIRVGPLKSWKGKVDYLTDLFR